MAVFVLKAKPTFQIDVKIPSIHGDGKIKFEFKHMGAKALAEFFDGLGKDPKDKRRDADILAELIIGWSGVDEPFSREGLDYLFDNYPGAVMQCYESYLTALRDGEAKNS